LCLTACVAAGEALAVAAADVLAVPAAGVLPGGADAGPEQAVMTASMNTPPAPITHSFALRVMALP
jgi:hypothetical protein